ncbi:hypothetical protein C2857_001295 [Epichloe festucae Fl1]|uniref:C2H2-type domain-containing protein n=1 Tax=Epichloe festucae (strain Fl1) TaxID=877507 RepID=A0A7U3Q0X9_EPIFF|nr:hypothetical protein C2857_001295 [Epichloe festucae Fl1]
MLPLSCIYTKRFSPQKNTRQDCYNSYQPATSCQEGDFSATLVPTTLRDTCDKLQTSSTELEAQQNQPDSPSNLMQSDTWGSPAHITPKRGHTSHQRESSLSSLGSTGPASPYTQNTSYPHVALADSGFEGAAEMQSPDSNYPVSYYQLDKSVGSVSHAPFHNADGSIPDISYQIAVPSPDKRARLDKGRLLASELSKSCTKSHSASAASHTRDDSPATAVVGDLERSNRRKNGMKQTFFMPSELANKGYTIIGYNHIPKLDRTMTDVYGDELYNPNFAITSTSSPQAHSVISVGSDVFSQRINAANHQHLSAAQSPGSTGSRARSPFRTSSPFSTSPARGFAAPHLSSTQQWCEQNHNNNGQISHLESAAEPETPKTISPKDAVLEFNEAETDWVLPLFPQDSTAPEIDSLSKTMNSQRSEGIYIRSNTADVQSHGFGYLPSQLPTGIQVPQQYPFIAHPTVGHDSPPTLSSSGASSVTSGGNTPTGCRRPTNIGADSGTYTCTYHGCTLRFETPTLLQKHKREGHRQTQTLVAPRVQDSGMSSNVLNTQTGPHRCDRINPSTGKSCNTIFSRPYDLTRHEHTIHNARKQKVRCNLCTEDKTFSRADALTRHYRVCHPDMELPGKPRRRGGV